MMKFEARWMAKLVGRTLANALAGGLAFAIVGAFCGGATGCVLGLIFVGRGSNGLYLVLPGAFVGALCGVVGLFIHAIAAVTAPPDGDLLEPFFDLAARVSQGQLWGTIAACAALVAFGLAKSAIYNVGFSESLGEEPILIMMGAPALMIYGAIAFALFKRD